MKEEILIKYNKLITEIWKYLKKYSTTTGTEEFWMNSQLSLARHYGRISNGGNVWYIVNSRGMDLWECTDEATKLGCDKAIPAGEPADLVRSDFIKYYRKLGRDRFLEVLKDHQQATDKELKAIYKELIKPKKKVEEPNINFDA